MAALKSSFSGAAATSTTDLYRGIFDTRTLPLSAKAWRSAIRDHRSHSRKGWSGFAACFAPWVSE